MSAIEETPKSQVNSTVTTKRSTGGAAPILNRVLDFLSSVRFGIVQLIIVIALAMAGMLIVQQNVDGFDKYFAQLTPSQKMLYGGLGLFDVYHAWYFHLLLLTLSLNIVLASIDRAPITWRIIKGRKLTASRQWLGAQQVAKTVSLTAPNAVGAREQVVSALKRFGLKATVTEQNGNTNIFAERGAWNRLGYLAVHVALLTIFAGGFLTAQFGRDGMMPLAPGESGKEVNQFTFDWTTPSEPKVVQVALPFTVECTDVKQKLIHLDGSIEAGNTIDWSTNVKITDEYGTREAVVSLNKPYDYRGYRFFQASFSPQGNARTITLALTPQTGGAPITVEIPRNGTTTLNDGTKIGYEAFSPDFTLEGSAPSTRSNDYNNPAAILTVTSPSGETRRAFAFEKALPEGAPVGNAVLGYKYKLASFEKASLSHTLAINKDPGKPYVYLGFFGLMLTLCAVFFFSHQRVWILIEPNAERSAVTGREHFDIVIGGNTNRNKLGFEDRVNKLGDAITGENQEVKS